MNQPESEADARIEIDELLRQAGWDPADKSMVGTEIHSAAGDGSHSRADYVLYDQRGRPLAVIEAKKNAIDPYVAKQQALPYAQSLGAPFIFLANGELTYFWDYRNEDARQITGFFSRRDLERLVEMRASRSPPSRSPSTTSARARPAPCGPIRPRRCAPSTTASSWASAAS